MLLTLCIVTILLSLIDWWRSGWSFHTALLIGGAIASVVASLILATHCTMALQATKRPVAVNAQVAFTVIGFVPFAFALYVIGFQGLYAAALRFSVAQLVQSVSFLLCGHWIAVRIRRLQEFQSCLYEQLNRSRGEVS